ncbi:YhdP family protein [Gilvimarinus sp. F26214L]|uniref:YhdP family protein n=1 Tax=Gilvimarinus sp. DZF01 TaxID=3461371 RepID=UPI00404558E4
MRNLTRTFVKRFWGLCAFVLIGLAVVVTLGRELAPQVGQYRPEIERYLSSAMDAQVTITAITASWEGLSPELTLTGLSISSHEGEQILAVDTAFAELSIMRSLANGELVLGQLEFVDMTMGFRQRADGSWTLPGLPPRPADSEAIDLSNPLDIFLLGDRIQFRDAHFSFDFRSGHRSEVSLPQLLLENNGTFHRLSSEVAVDRNRDVLALVMEAEGDPRDPENFTAKGHLKLQQFELDKAVAALPGRFWDGLPNQEWRKGHQLNLELWFDVSEGMAAEARGYLDIGELPVDVDEGLSLPTRTTAGFVGQWGRNGDWQVALRDLSLKWEDGSAEPLDLLFSSEGLGKPVQLQVASLDIAHWYKRLNAAGLLPGAVGEALEVLQPGGQLRNGKMTLAGTRLEDLALTANVDGLTVESWRGAPAVTGVDAYLEAKGLSGFVDLASEQGFSMHYPTIYRDALQFERARGRVHWRVDLDDKLVKIHSGLVSLNGAVGEAHGYFSLFLPFEGSSHQEELIVQAGLRDSSTRYHKQFVPYILPEPLLNWLDQSVGEGRVSSGGFIYRGGLRAETAAAASVQLFLNVQATELAYHPEWPALRQGEGVVWLDDRTVRADLESARVLDTQLTGGEILVEANEKGGRLTLRGSTEGDASDGLRILRETPLGQMLGGEWYADWVLQGSMKTALDLTVPLAAGGEAEIRQIQVDVEDTRLSMQELGLEVGSVAGTVIYDPEGLHGDQLSGRLWGEPIQGRIATRPATDDQPRQLELSFQGRASIDSLKTWLPLPELEFADGKAAATARIELPFEAGGSGEPPRLVVSSDLEGVAVDLPPPFGKPAAQPRTFRFSTSLGSGQSLYDLRYAELLHGLLEVENGQLERGALMLGGGSPSLPASRTLHVGGHLARFEPTQWQQVLTRYQAARESGDASGRGASLEQSLDLHFGSVAVRDLELNDVQLRGQGQAEQWDLNLESDAVAGRVRLFPHNRPMLLELDHLHLPEKEQETPAIVNPFLPLPEPEPVDLLAEVDPRSLPALDFSVRSLSLGGEDYGSWTFRLRPTAEGVLADSIVGSVRGGQIVGRQAGEGAKLYWEKVGERLSSRFEGRFVTDNLGSVLEQWNQPRLLDSESSEFDATLSWPGSPAAMALTALQGQIVMDVERGTFIRGAGEASTGSALLELIAFFNFDTWLRRLRLDFSDLTRAGTAFETIEGSLHFEEGSVFMHQPVVVNSHSSRFQMAGEVDLMESRLDTKLVATIPVGGNLTFVAALAGMGLPTVAGMWLISKVFEEQIGKMSSLSFHVTGPLNDPDMDFVRLFDDQAVQADARSGM